MGLNASETATWLVHHARHIAAAVALAVLWTIESVAPMFVGRQRRFSHNANNLGLAAVNTVITSGFAGVILAVTEWSRTRGFGLLNLGTLPNWLHWIGAIMLFDCWQYWWHRFNHRVPMLWRFHAVHHADAEMDVSSGVRFHTIELTFSSLARLLVLPAIGVTMPELLVYEAISLPIILFHHSNLRISETADRCFRWLIPTPRMHYVHHSRWQPETDSNYTSFLSVWDRIFGSFRLRERPSEISLGLEHWSEEEWRPLSGLLIAPFRKARPPPTRPPTASEIPEK